MPETLSNICTETNRTFTTAPEARASEARFLEIQEACDSGQIPKLRKGDVIYVDTEIYISHGRDDFRGGMAEVVQYGIFIRSSRVPFVRVAQEPDTQHNWETLAPIQKNLRREFGKKWAHPDPDLRPEFNEG